MLYSPGFSVGRGVWPASLGASDLLPGNGSGNAASPAIAAPDIFGARLGSMGVPAAFVSSTMASSFRSLTLDMCTSPSAPIVDSKPRLQPSLQPFGSVARSFRAIIGVGECALAGHEKFPHDAVPPKHDDY